MKYASMVFIIINIITNYSGGGGGSGSISRSSSSSSSSRCCCTNRDSVVGILIKLRAGGPGVWPLAGIRVFSSKHPDQP